MRILLDLLPVTRGGGLQNARNLWRAVAEGDDRHQWLAVARPDADLAPWTTASHQQLEEWEVSGFLRRLALENARLPALAKRFDADVVFTPMGAGPLRGGLPRVIGWHDSSLAYPESELWMRTDWRFRGFEAVRQRYVARAARTARRICVQTETMAGRLGRVWGVPRERFRIVPNGPSEFLAAEAPRQGPAPDGPLRILVIGEPKPTKNLEIVPHVARALSAHGLRDWEIVMTIPAEGGEWLTPFESALEAVPQAVRERIHRIGVVPHESLGDLYRSSAAVLLPSFLESFSATYVEAMHFGVPLVTSDMDFARDICGRAARYADPFDAGALAAALAEVLTSPEVRAELAAEGRRVLATLPDWTRRLQLYTSACQEAVDARDVHRAVLQTRGAR